MSKFLPKKLIRKLIEKLGYDIKLNRISSKPFEGKNIAFLHIAKCGGISIDTALRSSFARVGQHKLDRVAAIETTFSRFHQELESPENSALFADEHVKTLNTLMSYYLGMNWSYVSGHANITSKQLELYAAKYQFMTVLRDPIERFISHYTYTKLTNSLPIMLPNKFSTDNLVEEAESIILSRRGWHMMNTPTMCLTGRYPKDHSDANVMKSEVLSNLAHFSVVGFLSDLDTFTQQVERLTGKSIEILHRNASHEFVDETQQKIRNTLKEYFSQKTTLNTLNKLGNSEIENFKKAQDIYLGQQ